MEKKKKVVVAFSGGLDTSFTVMYLAKEKGYEVYAACANTGGFSPEQLKTNEENAYKLGAKEYVTIDVTQEYYEKSLKYMVFGNVLRNGTYPISVSSERIFQASPKRKPRPKRQHPLVPTRRKHQKYNRKGRCYDVHRALSVPLGGNSAGSG